MTAPRSSLPDSYEGILQRARTARDSGDIEGALALYRRLVDRLGRLNERILARRRDLREMEVQARSEMADLLYFKGGYAEAIEVMQVLLETRPEEADTWRREIAILRLAKGEAQAGLDELRALAEQKPDDIWRWLVLGMQARIEGRFAESQTALDQALEAGSADDPKALAFAHYQRFVLSRDLGRVDDALAAWEQVVALDPQSGEAVQEVYTMLTDAGRYSEALRYVAQDPNELLAGFQRGLIARLTGQLVEAREEWQAVAAMNPTNFERGHASWMEAVLRLGDPDPVLDRAQELIVRHGTPRLLVFTGIAWAMQGNVRLASTYFQQTISLLRRDRPPKQKLDSADWHLLDSLVADERIKAELKSYFAVLETLWGASSTSSRPGQDPIFPPLRT
jgi:tetratricopeptide (TPR) repeat protein